MVIHYITPYGMGHVNAAYTPVCVIIRERRRKVHLPSLILRVSIFQGMCGKSMGSDGHLTVAMIIRES